ECIVSEKQWTIYRRFHDFKQLAHQLKNESVRVSPVPTRTLMRSLDLNFLRKRQLELDRWLREVLMLISLENCKEDTDRFAECCGNRGFHASCRLIRHFLTHKANEPPVFDEASNASASLSSSGSFSFTNSGSGRAPLFSISEQKTDSESMSSLDAATTTTATAQQIEQIEQLSSSLRDSDLLGAAQGEEPMDDGQEAPFNAATVADQRRSPSGGNDACDSGAPDGRDVNDNDAGATETGGVGSGGMPYGGIAGSAGTATSSAERNSTLRNLSYTFAGFTYDGTSPSIARSGSFAYSSAPSSYLSGEI
ncbi:hypothetical protein BBJ28_00014530, partial [Nothophytophthora sp. Chile5]